MTDLLYRRGSAKDLKQLQELRIISYSEFAEKMTAVEKDIFLRNLNDEEMLAKIVEVSKVFVCVYDSRIIGMAYLVSSGNPTNVFPAEWCYIRMVGVDPRYRGSGIAKTLTLQCIDHAKTTGESIIALHTSEAMDAARHIYEGLGFKVFKEIDRIFGLRYWLYTLNLSDGNKMTKG